MKRLVLLSAPVVLLMLVFLFPVKIQKREIKGFIDFGSHHRLNIPVQPRTEQAQAKIDEAKKQQVFEGYGRIPLSFEKNQGQAASEVKFLSRGNGYNLFLTPTEAVLALSKPSAASNDKRDRIGDLLRMKMVGANSSARITGMEEMNTKSNYFIGNDPKKWLANISNYQKVKYEAVYPGVDMVYYGNQRQLEYDFVVSPGADTSSIKLSFDGAEKLELDAEGNLILSMQGGQIRQHRPFIYQQMGSGREEIAGSYVLKGKREVGFKVAAYDRSRPLIIDPVLTYSTYLGGSGIDRGIEIAVDSTGNAYVTGFTNSVDFPRMNAYQNSLRGGLDAFVTKLNASGNSLLYSTYLGGTGNELGTGIAIDSTGNAFVSGFTDSSDFPTQNAYQNNPGGGVDTFVTKLNATGSSLVYSTYLGGTNEDLGSGIAIDSTGNAFVSGFTGSSDFPTQNAFQSAFGGTIDAFVTKLNASGSSLLYSTYLGGTDDDQAYSIAIDSTGNAYVTGRTFSVNFPTQNAYQNSLSGSADAFVTKLNASGSSLVYSTYLGGTGDEENFGEFFGIAVDSAGNAYVSGGTNSSDFPTQNAFQSSLSGGFDAYVTKLNATGNSLLYSTYLGGTGDELGFGIAIDSTGNAVVSGFTTSGDFPTQNAFQPAFGGSLDVFVTRLNSSGSSLVYSSYLGGTGDEFGAGIAVVAGNVYLAGFTASSDFPTKNAFQSTLSGDGDGFVVKISDDNVLTVNIDIKPGSFPNSINLGSNGIVPVAIFSSASFDATTIDPLTVTLANANVKLKGNGSPQFSFQDVNNDGRTDMVVQVLTQALELTSSDTEAVLTGQTFNGTKFRGVDSVRIVN